MMYKSIAVIKAILFFILHRSHFERMNFLKIVFSKVCIEFRGLKEKDQGARWFAQGWSLDARHVSGQNT